MDGIRLLGRLGADGTGDSSRRFASETNTERLNANMTDKQKRLMEEALSEHGIMPFYEGDVVLVNGLCEIIGELHCTLQACKDAVEDGSKLPSSRMELVRDYATPLLAGPIGKAQTR